MRGIFLSCALFFASVPAMAQMSVPAGCNASPGGTIRGLTRDDSTWEMIPHQVMIIADLNCRTETNTDGVFQFNHVPAGQHLLRTSSMFAYRKKAVSVKVADDSVSNVEFQLLPANSVDDCLEVTAVSYGECGLNDTTSTSTKRHMIHKPTGRDAGVFYGGRVTMIDANTFDNRAMYYSNPLLISWWNCQFAKLSRMWIPVSCRPEIR